MAGSNLECTVSTAILRLNCRQRNLPGAPIGSLLAKVFALEKSRHSNADPRDGLFARSNAFLCAHFDRYTCKTKFGLSHRKQSAALHSNRYTFTPRRVARINTLV